jgi:outer membrane protein
MILATAIGRLLARRALAMCLVVPAAAVFFVPSAAFAQSGGTRIAVVNAQKVYNEMKETQDLQKKMNDENARLTTQSNAKAAALQKMKADRDASYKPGSPQYAEKNRDLIKATLEFEVWSKFERANMEDMYKQQMKLLFDKVQGAIAEVATKDGYDLVVTDTSERLPDNLEQVDVRTMKLMMLQKSVLFASPKVDITQMVIIVLDKKYSATAVGK